MAALMVGFGLFGIPFPEEIGGGGGDLTTPCIAIEELARADVTNTTTTPSFAPWERAKMYAFWLDSHAGRYTSLLVGGPPALRVGDVGWGAVRHSQMAIPEE